MSRAASRFLVIAMATLLATGWLSARPSLVRAAGSISLAALDTPSTENFDTLSNSAGTTTNSLAINGWAMTESGGGARDNEQYAVDTGGSNTGDTYSYGAALNTDRAFGALRSGTLVPLFGASFTNNAGATITSLDVAYTGEEWRSGTAARTDQINFEYSTSATDLTTGTWSGVPALNFVTPETSIIGPKDGNAAANRTAVSTTIGGQSIANGATFWIRWTDTDASGADDGLSVDDFSLTPRGAGTTTLSINDVSHNESSGSQLYDFTVSLTAPAGPGGVTFDITTQDGSATTANNDYIAQSLTGRSIPEGSADYLFSVIVNGDSVPEADETFFVNVTNVSGASVADGQGQGTLVNDDGNACADPVTPIYAIQGSGLSTPIPGSVTTRGVIVGDFQGPITSGLQGFYIQDQTGDANTTTSDGLFVFTGANDNGVNVGDVVAVSGFARERFSVTTLNGANSDTSSVINILVCSTGNPLPAPTQVLLPFATANSPEAYEGMLVTLPQALVIADYFNYDQFGEIVLAQPLPGETRPFSGTAIDAPGAAANARTATNVLSRIILDDGLAAQNVPTLRHPNGAAFSLTNAFRGGDTVTDTLGVLTFDFSRYRIEPTGPATYTAVNPRPAAPADTRGRLTVAAQNTLNFFITADYPSGDPAEN
jgi:hypothetical protein